MVLLEVKFEWDLNGVIEEIADVDTATIGETKYVDPGEHEVIDINEESSGKDDDIPGEDPH